MKTGNQSVVLIITISFLILITALGYLFLRNQKLTPKIASTQPYSAENSNSSTVTAADNSDTYQATGFSFKYPKSFYIESKNQNETVWTTKTSESYFLLRSGKNLLGPKENKEFIVSNNLKKTIKVTNIDEEKQITVDNKPISWLTISCGVDCYYHLVSFKVDNIDYQIISEGAGGGLKQQFEKIIETLKFSS